MRKIADWTGREITILSAVKCDLVPRSLLAHQGTGCRSFSQRKAHVKSVLVGAAVSVLSEKISVDATKSTISKGHAMEIETSLVRFRRGREGIRIRTAAPSLSFLSMFCFEGICRHSLYILHVPYLIFQRIKDDLHSVASITFASNCRIQLDRSVLIKLTTCFRIVVYNTKKLNLLKTLTIITALNCIHAIWSCHEVEDQLRQF